MTDTTGLFKPLEDIRFFVFSFKLKRWCPVDSHRISLTAYENLYDLMRSDACPAEKKAHWAAMLDHYTINMYTFTKLFYPGRIHQLTKLGTFGNYHHIHIALIRDKPGPVTHEKEAKYRRRLKRLHIDPFRERSK